MNNSQNTVSLSGQEVPAQRSRALALGLSVLAILLYLVLVDGVVESFVSHSPLRWTICGAVAVYVALSVLLWRKLGWTTKAAVSFFVLLSLMAFAAWRPEGSDSPLTLLRQPTSTLLSAGMILGILLAGWILARLKFLPWPARVGLVLLAAYGVAGFVVGIMARTPYATLLHGGSLWEKLPFWLQGAFLGAVVVLPFALVVQLFSGVSQIRAGELHDWGARVLVLGLCATITASGITSGAGPFASMAVVQGSAPLPPPPPSAAADADSLDLSLPESDAARVFEGAQRLMEKAPTETYDVSAAAKSLGDDIDKNFAFVRDNFAFDPYAGCLRGAQGTLMARAGNDVDRSLLLAALLKSNGHEVRLVRGTLSDADATRLLARAKQPPVPPPVSNTSVEEAAAISGLPVADLQKLFNKAKVVAQQVSQNLDARVQYDTAFIQQKLQAAGIHLSPVTAASPEVVRSHVWVQVQVGDAWKDLDSSFPDAKLSQRFAEPEGDPIAADSIPGDWYQALRFRVLSLAPGASNADELLNQQLRVADLVAQPLSLVFAPKDNDDPVAANTFQPTLVAATNQYTGTNIELGPAKESGGAVGGMIGGLAGGGEEEAGKESEKPQPKILLEVTLEGPGGAPERVTRIVADTSAIQDSAQRLTEMRDQLASLYQFVVAVGPIPSEWLASQLLTFLKQFASNDEKDQVFMPIDLLNLAMAATQGDDRRDQPRRYYARPLLMAQRLRFRHGPEGEPLFTKTIDILHNRVEFLSGDALAALRQGARETELERAALTGREVLNTTVVFERTPAGSVRVLGPSDANALSKMDLGAEAKARIGEDLASGYAVIVPSTSVQIAGMPALGWWRVRPLGGETLGRMQSGEGQGMVEKALTLVPSGYSGIAGFLCKRAGNTKGLCNPCLIAFAGFVGTVLGVYGWVLASGWGLGQIAFTMGTGAYGAWKKGAACGGFAIKWGTEGSGS